MTLVTEWFATRGENLVPSAERQSVRVYVRNRGEEVILRLLKLKLKLNIARKYKIRLKKNGSVSQTRNHRPE